jgi:hypothetical protein
VNSESRPHEPTFVVVERFEGERTEGIGVPITANELGAEQNPNQVRVGHVCNFRWSRFCG